MAVTDFENYPCGADGLSFPQGLPDPEQKVEVLTVWSNGKWEPKTFCEKYSWCCQYGWFGVYSKPDVDRGSMPIVLDWRDPKDTQP